jgi:2-polyprenyl-6-methoxyphenol hydroxylase-like FAD-dependent oxidoreductase
MKTDYDVIVVGARCAGAPTAMLLARRGYRVLLVDKAFFPSDTMSTHLIHPPGVAALDRWGLLDDVRATGCPPITRYRFDFGPVVIEGSSQPVDGIDTSYGPRRILLDELLVRAAVSAGVELREGFTVEEVLVDGGRVTGIRGRTRGGATVTESARVVVGADGRHSLVAKTVDAPRYNEVPALQCGYYAYWSGLPTDAFEIYDRAPRGWGVIPTNDDLTLIVCGWPQAEFKANRSDIEGTQLRAFELAPEFADRVRGAKRETRFVGTRDLPNFFRTPYGPGWALVGDAGYHKDPITALGMTDAFHDAEGLATALDESFSGVRGYDEALSAYQQARDERALPMFGLTCDLAKLEPAPEEMQQLFGAVQTRQELKDDFVSVMAYAKPAPEFFAPENIERIMREAGGAVPA